MANKIQIRRDTAANWLAVNPVLTQGELGYELDTGRLKVGTGIAVWNTLAYFNDGADFSGAYADLTGAPTALSAFANDTGFITLADIPATTVPTALSELTNDTGFITIADIPAIPSDVGDLTDSGGLLGGVTPVNADWNATSGLAEILNKPTVVAIAPQWTTNHSLLPGGENTRYLAGDAVYDNGNIYVALFDNESLPTTDLVYWQNIGPGKRLNLDGRDVPNITYDQLNNKPIIPLDVSDLTDTQSLLGGGSGAVNEITNTDGNNTWAVSVATTGVISMNTARGGLEFGAMPEIGGPSHLHIMRPAGQESSTDLFFGDDYNYVKLPGLYGPGTQGVVIGSSYDSGLVNTWRFDTDGTTQFPNNKVKPSIGNILSVETEILPPEPPTTIVINGADFTSVNLTYTKDGANSIWYPAGYIPGTDPYIEFTGSQYEIFVPGFGQSLYVNTGTLNIPLAQWNINPPLGSVAPTGVYTYPSTYSYNWAFGTDGSLTFPDASVQATAYPGVLVPADGDTVSGSANLVFYDGSWNYTSRVTINPITSMLTLNGNSGTGGITFPDATVQTTSYVAPVINTTAAAATSLANNATANLDLTGGRAYILYKIQTDQSAWVRVYTTAAARTADAGRVQGVDPAITAGVVAEAITAGAETVVFAPAVNGFNNETLPTSAMPIAVTNLSGSTNDVAVTVTKLTMVA